MANKFKCLDCRHSFLLNDGSEHLCPKCKSENIKPQTSGAANIFGKFLIFAVMFAVGYFVTPLVYTNPKSEGTSEDKNTKKVVVDSNVVEYVEDGSGDKAVVRTDDGMDNPSVSPENNDTDDAKNKEPEPLLPIDAEFSVFEKKLAENGFTFSISVLAQYDSNVKQYELYLNENDNSPLLTSLDGTFKCDEYYTADGNYFVKAVYENGNSTLLKSIGAFVKPVNEPKPFARMEKDELQNKIDKYCNSRSGSDRKWFAHPNKGGDKRLADKVIVKNNTNGDTYPNISKMFSECLMITKKINVEDVSYDDEGRLNSITINIEK